MSRQPKRARPVCSTCGKPGTKWNPLPHDHTPAAVAGPIPVNTPLRLTRRGERVLLASAVVLASALGIVTAPGAPLALCWGGC